MLEIRRLWRISGYCEFTAPDEPPNIECWRWVMREIRTSVPARVWAESTTRQVNGWLPGGTAGLSSRTINTVNLPCGGNVQIFQRYGRGDAWIKDSPHRCLKRPSRFAAFLHEEIEQVLGCCNQIQWLLVKLSLTVADHWAAELRLMNIGDRVIVFTGKEPKQGGAYESRETLRKVTQWIVSQHDDYLWQRSAAPLAIEELRYLMRRQDSIWLDFAIFTARFAARSFSETGRHLRSHRRCSACSSAVIAAVFAWTGRRAGGSMLWKGEICTTS